MPDDRPVSPQEVVLGVLNDYRVGYTAPFKPDAMDRYRANLAAAITAALSTPAGPCPECNDCQRVPDPELTPLVATGEVPAGQDWMPCPRYWPAAPSPREEAVEALDRDALIEMVTSAISQAAADRPKKEGTRQRFRRYATAAVDVLSAARPSSPTPEEDA